MSLALLTLLYEWRRYVTAIVALAVSGLLVLSMVGMFVGMGKSNTATVDHSPAEVMILSPQSESLYNNGFSQPRRLIPMVYNHPQVLEAQSFDTGWASWANFPKAGQHSKSEGVLIAIVDLVEGSVTLPTDFSAEAVDALKAPYSVLVDKSALARLGVKKGDAAKINGRRVQVSEIIEGYPALFNCTIYMSRRTAELLQVFREGNRVGAIMVKIRDPQLARQVAAEINAMGGGQYRAWTRETLSERSQIALLKEGGISIILGFSVVVSTFIGVVITWQILQGAITASIKEFAGLRALGVPMSSLRLIVMELSLWVGILGLGLAGVFTGLVWCLAGWINVPMSFPSYVTLPVGVGLLLIAAVSGFFSLGVLNKAQPADLLR
ncbi:hypothetical protein AEAC466_05825 [Asticcacaulis sp. AC466]|uniref:ABC transporter permease n=1 Tax=Asticcacaulis sp. AC466 TaxID=1282362 RepID=UPI0003C3E87C|nr:ABC transporter permease [Asticcacaulis sp. AC466]ESQ85229.1 hypothetical protein AEAC466_05825 [Asticcacaulis sp. AC466]